MADDVDLQELRLAALGRREVVPGTIGLISVAAVLLFLFTSFVPHGDARPFRIWLAVMAAIVATVFALAAAYVLRQPGDRETVRLWLPLGRTMRTALNIAVIASPWVLLPAADPALRAIMPMLYLWFLATEMMATIDPRSQVWLALVGVPASLGLYLIVSHAPYAIALSLFLAMAGVSLFVIHRGIRGAAVLSLDRIASIPLPIAMATAEPAATPAAAPAHVGLTRRQVEVLRHLAMGLSNKEIARALGVSPATIKTHVAQTLAIMGAANRTDAAVRARTMGI